MGSHFIVKLRFAELAVSTVNFIEGICNINPHFNVFMSNSEHIISHVYEL